MAHSNLSIQTNRETKLYGNSHKDLGSLGKNASQSEY